MKIEATQASLRIEDPEGAVLIFKRNKRGGIEVGVTEIDFGIIEPPTNWTDFDPEHAPDMLTAIQDWIEAL